MLVAARAEGCLEQVLVIAAALSVQDPRERPLEQAAAADERHARFADERSDFLAFLKLWKLQDEPGLRRLCRENFLSYPRMREWRDVHAQLASTLDELDWPESSVEPGEAGGLPRDPPRAARRPARQRRHAGRGRTAATPARAASSSGCIPGSWTKKPGQVDRRRRAGRDHAPLRAHASRASSRSGWRSSARTCSSAAAAIRTGRRAAGQVVALERGTLYGLPVYVDRRVPFAPLDPEARARDLHPLGAGRGRLRHARAVLRAQPAPGRRDRAPRAQVAPAGHPGRRRADPRVLRRAHPEGDQHRAQTSSTGARRPSAREPKLLYLCARGPDAPRGGGHHHRELPARAAARPEPLRARIPLRAGLAARRRDHDGAARAAQPGAGGAHRMAGAGPAEGEGAARSPSRCRSGCATSSAPLDEFAEGFVAAGAALPTCRWRRRSPATSAQELNLEVPLDAFRPDSAPPHLHMNFRVVDDDGRQLGMGRNLAELKRELGAETEAILQEETRSSEDERYTGWTMGDLPELMEIERGGQTLVGYPALVDAERCGDAAGVRFAREGARAAPRAACGGCSRSRFATACATSSARSPRTWCSAPLKDDIIAAALERTFLAGVAADAAGRVRAPRRGGAQPLQPHRAGDRAHCGRHPRRAARRCRRS